MILTVFRSRFREGLSPEDHAAYMTEAAQMIDLARAQPGFVDVKSYASEDGERVTLVRFESEETHRAWAEEPRHREAQMHGKETYYGWFHIGVYTDGREYGWTFEESSAG